MKHYYIPHSIAFFLLFICSFTAMAQVSKNCNFSQLQYQYTDTIVNGITYRTYYADGLTLTETPGAPMIPCRIYKFSVPYNATNLSIVSNKNITQYSQLYNCTLMPAMCPKAMCDTTPDQILPDSTIYNTNAYYPNKVAEITGEGFYMGENHIVTVAVYPMQYNPVTEMLKFNQGVSFTITYTIGDDSTTNAIVRNDIILRQQAWDETKLIVENPTQVESFAPNEAAVHYVQMHYIPDSLQTQVGDSTANYGGAMALASYEYMIITTNALNYPFRRLAAFKRQKGYTVGVKCIEDILNNPNVQSGDKCLNYNGQYTYIADSAGILRQYLKLAHSLNKTQYVLFGGQNVPFRYWYEDGSNEFVPTDWYFNDLTTNWNKNNNNLYGERLLYNQLYYGSFDYFPELYVGRLMALDSDQIDYYTQKLLRYELNPGNGNTSYLKRAFLLNGFKEQRCQNLAVQLGPAYSSVFSTTQIIPLPTNTFPTGADVIGIINNNQFGFMGIHGHGNPITIKINGLYSSSGSSILSRDSYKNLSHYMGLDSLANKYYPSLMYAVACTTAPFDRYNLGNNQISMAQSFTLGKDYGGVAYLGNTRNGGMTYQNELTCDAKLEYLFLQSLSQGESKVGIAEALSKENGHYDYHPNGFPTHNLLTHSLIGEPEFEIWTDEPTQFSGITVSRSDNSISVVGINVDSTIVAICDNNGDAIRKYSANGLATFNNISPNSTIMLYKHNYLPYIAPQYIQNTDIENSQYVFASEVYIGRNVDNNRTVGDVTIPSGVNYEMEFTNSINITGGFEVEQGATFFVTPSDY